MKKAFISLVLVSFFVLTVHADLMYYTFEGHVSDIGGFPAKQVKYVFAIDPPPEHRVFSLEDGPFTTPWDYFYVPYSTTLVEGNFYFPDINTNNNENLICHEGFGGLDKYLSCHENYNGSWNFEIAMCGETRAASGSLSNHFVDLWSNSPEELHIGNSWIFDEGWINADGIYSCFTFLGIASLTSISSINPYDVPESGIFSLLSMEFLSISLVGIFRRKKKIS
jgi:hypothetical protein